MTGVHAEGELRTQTLQNWSDSVVDEVQSWTRILLQFVIRAGAVPPPVDQSQASREMDETGSIAASELLKADEKQAQGQSNVWPGGDSVCTDLIAAV